MSDELDSTARHFVDAICEQCELLGLDLELERSLEVLLVRLHSICGAVVQLEDYIASHRET
jgi:hypothetical protein